MPLNRSSSWSGLMWSSGLVSTAGAGAGDADGAAATGVERPTTSKTVDCWCSDVIGWPLATSDTDGAVSWARTSDGPATRSRPARHDRGEQTTRAHQSASLQPKSSNA